MGVGWAMLSSWGLSAADYVLYTLVTGIWNVFTLAGLPFLAVLVMATASTRPDATMITGAAAGLALLAAMVGGLGLLLHSEASALRAGRVLQYGLAVAAGWPAGHRPLAPQDRCPASATGRRPARCPRLADYRRHRGQPPHAVARPAGLPARCQPVQAQLPWQTSLAAFAVIRLLTAMPITPGGLGITELGLIGILADGAGHEASAQVTAAVLMYRAVTYLPTIPLGALAMPHLAVRTRAHHQRSAVNYVPARPASRPAGRCPDPRIQHPRREHSDICTIPYRRTARETRRSSHRSAAGQARYRKADGSPRPYWALCDDEEMARVRWA